MMEKITNCSPSSGKQRNRQNVTIYSGSLPGSRSSSPGRNVMSKRAIFEENNNASAKASSVSRMEQVFNNVAAESGETIEIEGVEEFDRIYNSSIQRSTGERDPPTTVGSMVAEFSRTQDSSERKNFDNDRSKSPARSEATERMPNVRIFPDYLNTVPKITIDVQSAEIPLSDKAERRRTGRGRPPRRKTLQVTTQTASVTPEVHSKRKQQYVPTYIQPVPSLASGKGYSGTDADSYIRSKRDALPFNQVITSSDTDETSTAQLKLLPKRVSRGKTVNYREANSSESQSMDVIAGPQCAAVTRKPDEQVHHSTRVLSKDSLPVETPFIAANTSGRSISSVERLNVDVKAKKENVAQAVSRVHSESQPPAVASRRNRVRKRYNKPPIVAETEEKYSTLPADFKPADTAASESSEVARTKQSIADNCNQIRFANRNELMITSVQTPLLSEDAKKKSGDVKADIAHHTVHTQSLPKNQANDKTGSNFKTSAERRNAPPAQINFHSILEQSRSKFSADQTKKIEFGIAYNKVKPATRIDSPTPSRRIKEKAKLETENVVHSQPMIKAVKVSEHYWPRDAATEKLLKPNQPSSSSALATSLGSSTEPPSNMSHFSKDTASYSNIDLPKSPKETNLNDPISLDPIAAVTHVSSPRERDAKLNAINADTHNAMSPNQSSGQPQPLSLTGWSLDDPDQKLKEFDNSFNSDGGRFDAGVHLPAADPADSDADDATLSAAECDAAQSHNAGTLSEKHVLIHNKIAGEVRQYSSSPRSPLPSTGSSKSHISTSERKDSVVSDSTALPKNISLPETRNSVVSVDEGCFVDDPDPKAAMESFKAISQSLGNKERIDINAGRRRRKGSAANGQNGSDSSNSGENSNRSLSDPTPKRKKSPNAETEMNGALDSNFQFPLKPQTHHKFEDEGANCDMSEYSDRDSIRSSCLTESQTTINEPDHLSSTVDVKIPKPPKKKSFSDPDSKAVLTAGLMNEGGLSANTRCSSSSDPNLSEKPSSRTGPGEGGMKSRMKDGAANSIDWSSRESGMSDIGDITQSIEKLSESLATDHHLTRPPKKNLHPNEDDPSDVSEDSQNYFKPIRGDETDAETLTETDSLNAFLIENPVEKEELQFNQIFDMLNRSDSSSSSKAPIVHERSRSQPIVSGSSITRRVSERGRRAGIVEAPPLNDILSGNKSAMNTLQAHKQTPTETERVAATLPRAVPVSQGSDYRDFERPTEIFGLRKPVFDNFREAETSYVKSLRIIHEYYLEPLKRPENQQICDPKLVDGIFYKIPEIRQHHEKFLENINEFHNNWDPYCKIGELLRNAFNQDTVLDIYTSYIKNYTSAREAIHIACSAKTGFKAFLEQCKRDDPKRQSLSGHMIQPVQRIPRYELIIKDLLKHTPDDHPDHESLLIAKKEFHSLAVRMDEAIKAVDAAERNTKLLQEIELSLESYADISGSYKRRYLQQYFCAETLKSGSKKDRCLLLFSDLLICTAVKKNRNQAIRRSSMNLSATGQEQNHFDSGFKYKLLWKHLLEDIEVQGDVGAQINSEKKAIHQLHEDRQHLYKIEEISTKLNCQHLELSDLIARLLVATDESISQKQEQLLHLADIFLQQPARLEILLPSAAEGSKMVQFDFYSDADKTNFAQMFRDAKNAQENEDNRFSVPSPPAKNEWEPDFVKRIPISKTWNGMQFSCASPCTDATGNNKEVWVCNTDGHVGQICFLPLDLDSRKTQCVNVCKSKICCITMVPSWDRKLVPTYSLLDGISKAPLGNFSRRRPSTNSNIATTIMPFDEESDDSYEDNTSPISTINTTSPYSTMNTNISPYSTLNSNMPHDEELILPTVSPLLPSPLLCKNFKFNSKFHAHSISCLPFKEDFSDTDLQGIDPSTFSSRLSQTSVMTSSFAEGGGAYKKDSDGMTRYGSLGDLLNDASSDGKDLISGSQTLGNQPSMWLGTEDGKINIFTTSDTLGSLNSRFQLYHPSSVQTILNHQDQVFVALSNGDLVIYSRDYTNGGQWNFTNKKTIEATSSNNPITKMLVVNEVELWCGCQNQVRIRDLRTHLIKDSFTVSTDVKMQIFCMASCGFGVWVALDKKSQIKLYNTLTHELITEIDVTHAATKMLSNCDAIIRQHKTACLRITSLLVCKDLLWIGTSAGVVLALTLPTLSETTSHLPFSISLQPKGLSYGHTGNVRFLTAVEMASHPRGSRRSSVKRRSSSASVKSSHTSTLVISGGDGYEDFHLNAMSEAAGREDSTNHLLVWKV